MYSDIIRIRLRAERELAGYSQQNVADRTGIDDSIIAKIEIGTRKPDVETVGKLATFYEVSTDYLYGLGPKNKKASGE